MALSAAAFKGQVKPVYFLRSWKSSLDCLSLVNHTIIPSLGKYDTEIMKTDQAWKTPFQNPVCTSSWWDLGQHKLIQWKEKTPFFIAVWAELLGCINNDPLESAPLFKRKGGKQTGGREGGREPWAIVVAVVLTIERRSPARGLKGKPSTQRKVDGPSFGEPFLGASWESSHLRAMWREHCVGRGMESQGWVRSKILIFNVDCFPWNALCCVMLWCFWGMEKRVVSSVSQSCPHLRAGTVSAVSTVTVLGIWWGFHRKKEWEEGLWESCASGSTH